MARPTVEQDGETSKLKELTMHTHKKSSDPIATIGLEHTIPYPRRQRAQITERYVDIPGGIIDEDVNALEIIDDRRGTRINSRFISLIKRRSGAPTAWTASTVACARSRLPTRKPPHRLRTKRGLKQLRYRCPRSRRAWGTRTVGMEPTSGSARTVAGTPYVILYRVDIGTMDELIDEGRREPPSTLAHGDQDRRPSCS